MPRVCPEDPPLTVGSLRLEPGLRRAQRADRAIPLGPVELELLRALMRHPGQALSKVQLATALGRQGCPTRDAAVPVHIHHLRRKIGDGLIRTVRGAGYVIRADDGLW